MNFTSPDNGEIIIEVRSYGDMGSGAYTLTIEEVESATATAPATITATASLTPSATAEADS